MKKILFLILSVLMTGCLQAQQYPVYAFPSGILKDLPNGNPVLVSGATNAATTTITDNNILNFTVYPTWAQAAAGPQQQQVSSTKLTFNPFSGILSSPTFSGSLSGNANTASLLQTSRNINGVAFNGGASITVTADAGTLTGAALNSTVTSAPGLLSASVGTFGTLATQNANNVTISGGTMDAVTVTGLPTPVNANDAASKIYVDNAVSAGLVVRTGVAVATTANITLSGEQTIDGVLTSSTRILVKNQTLTENNGIYVTGSGAWTRAVDSDTAGELKVGYYYFVSAGTTQGATGWSILTAPTVLGTDPVVFGQFSSSTTYTAGTGLNLIGNAFSIASAQSGLAITGSTFNGSLGATTPSTGVFTQITNTTGNNFFGKLVAKSNNIDETATNALTSVDINFDGFNGGTTQFRNLNVYDGKNNLAATFTGSTKALNVVGPITAATFNGLAVTTSTGTLTVASSKTLTASNTLTFAGTDGTTMTFPGTSASIARTDAGNTFIGHNTFEGVTATGATGTGKMVYDTNPTLGAITVSSVTIANTAGTVGSTNAPTVGQQLYFNPFTNGTTTTITLPSAVNGNSFMLYFQAANGISSVTFTGASVFRQGDPDVALPSGVYVPGPAGNHSAMLKMVNSRWLLSDDSFQASYVADTGGANAYVMTLVPALTAYTTGAPLFTFIAGNSNTTASTLNINGLGVKTIKKFVGGANTDLVANDIRAGQVVVVAYDGTNFQAVSTLGNGGGGSGTGISLTKIVTAAGHGLSVGTLYGMWNSTGTTWVKASASSSGLGKITGIAQPLDANTFTLIEAGDITTTGLTAGAQYYLTDDGSGLLTQTQPSTTTSFVVPVMIAGSTTLAAVQIGPAASLTPINFADLNTNVARATVGSNDFFYGNAGNATVSGIKNTGVGGVALSSLTTGGGNSALGYNALGATTTGNSNTATGHISLAANTTGSANSATGYQALTSNTTGSNNTAVGISALQTATGADNNTSIGAFTLQVNTTGTGNVALGNGALIGNTTGSSQTGLGFQALADVTTGGNNTALGYNTGRGITTGTSNTILGANVTGLTAGLSSNIILANGAGTIKAQHNNTQWTFDTFAVDTLAHQRTTKGNLNLTINVKDYGALGDGSTNDTTAITAAVAAIPATNGILYFPSGSYVFNPTTAGLNALASKTNLTICGDGIGTSTLLSNIGAKVISLASSCSYVSIYGLTINGGCTARTTGSQAFSSTAAFTNIHDVEIKQSGEFACYIFSTTDVQVSNVSVNTCYADGININGCTRVKVSNCFVTGSDDDCYAIAGCTDVVLSGGYAQARPYGACLNAGVVGGNDYIPQYAYNNTASTPPASGTFRMNSTTPSAVTLVWINDTDSGAVTATSSFSFLTTGNILLIQKASDRPNTYISYTLTGSATHTGAYTICPVTFLASAGTISSGDSCSVAPASMWGRGLWCSGDTDMLVNGLSIDTVKQSGVRGEILSSTRNTRVHLKGLKVRNSTASVGGGGNGLWWVNSTDNSIENCTVEDVAAGSLIVAADWQNLTISGSTLTQTRSQFCRGFDVDSLTTPTAWNGLKLINNSINLIGASTNEDIRMVPNSAITITNTAIIGNVCSQAAAGDYIVPDYVAAPTKIGNNVSQEGKSITAVVHGTAATTFNNN